METFDWIDETMKKEKRKEKMGTFVKKAKKFVGFSEPNNQPDWKNAIDATVKKEERKEKMDKFVKNTGKIAKDAGKFMGGVVLAGAGTVTVNHSYAVAQNLHPEFLPEAESTLFINNVQTSVHGNIEKIITSSLNPVNLKDKQVKKPSESE
jgi:hypothetical protein